MTTYISWQEREDPAPWNRWGKIDVDDVAIGQMASACRLPVAVRGALMPDAHVGYGLPIGGVLAVRKTVIPYAVGVDIACRMRLTVVDWPVAALADRREELRAALENETRFGEGVGFHYKERRQHGVMDDDWSITRVIAKLKDRAWKQLGSSGGGNHFVEFGELHLPAPDLGLSGGKYLALLTHSGSRGPGHEVAEHYSRLAKQLRPDLPPEIKSLAWLEEDSEAGREYWAAMELMGRYAAANHDLIHQHILAALGAETLATVENHHNFAWREEHDDQELIVHRKGATPAGCGQLGLIPGSMASPGYVVRGLGRAESLASCSHGAGRCMSRAAALNSLNRTTVSAFLAEKGVELISGGLDEAPMAYKDIQEVMAAQADLVDIVASFMPRLVKMAPGRNNARL